MKAHITAVLLLRWSSFAAGSYHASFVEHKASSPCGNAVCGAQTLAANAATYASLAKAAAEQGAEVLVFPEYGLTGFSSYPKSSWISGGYTEEIPATTGLIPCDDSSGNFGPTLVTLSCAAKETGVVLVANLVDLVTEGKTQNIYNTDVALDADGTFLAKYHKLNLWGESNMDVPSDCPAVSFTSTVLGRNFGLLTCADLIYEQPTKQLLAQNISDFLVPVAWDDSMAQMQVMAWAQAFSLVYSVNLVVANHRTSAESGSGIWASGVPLAVEFSPSASGSSTVVVAEVPDDASSSDTSKMVRSRPTGQGASAAVTDMTKRLLLTSASSWNMTDLSEGAVVRSGDMSCSASDLKGSEGSGYVLAVLNGQDTSEGLTWGAQVCAILPCSSSAQPKSCLSYTGLPSAGGLTSGTLRIEDHGAALPRSEVSAAFFPEVLASDSTKGTSQTALSPLDDGGGLSFSFTTGVEAGSSSAEAELSFEATEANAEETSFGLLSAVIYGRSFADDDLPYSC